MDKATGMPLEDSEGNPVTSTAEFVAESSEGTVEITFEFDAFQLEEGASLVAFEEVLDVNGNVIAVHQDLEDEGQTVVVDQPRDSRHPLRQDGRRPASRMGSDQRLDPLRRRCGRIRASRPHPSKRISWRGIH